MFINKIIGKENSGGLTQKKKYFQKLLRDGKQQVAEFIFIEFNLSELV